MLNINKGLKNKKYSKLPLKLNLQLFGGGDDGTGSSGNGSGDGGNGQGSITLEAVQKFLTENEAGKKWLQSHTDSRVTQGIETFKEKSMPKILQEKIEEEIKKRYPPETEEQKTLREMKEKFAKLEKEREREALKNKAITFATEKGLPIKLVDFFVGEDEQSTNVNLETLEKVWGEALTAAVEKKFKENGRNVHSNNNNNNNNDDEIGKRLAEKKSQIFKNLAEQQNNYFK